MSQPKYRHHNQKSNECSLNMWTGRTSYRLIWHDGSSMLTLASAGLTYLFEWGRGTLYRGNVTVHFSLTSPHSFQGQGFYSGWMWYIENQKFTKYLKQNWREHQLAWRKLPMMVLRSLNAVKWQLSRDFLTNENKNSVWRRLTHFSLKGSVTNTWKS